VTALPRCSDVDLLGYGERIVDLHAEIQAAVWRRSCEAVRCRAVDKLLAKADLERIAAPAGAFAGS
jgi:hypothetical protein